MTGLELIVGLFGFWLLILSGLMIYVMNFKQEALDMCLYAKKEDLGRKLELYTDRCESLIKYHSTEHLRKDHGYYYDTEEVKVRIDQPVQPAVKKDV